MTWQREMRRLNRDVFFGHSRRPVSGGHQFSDSRIVLPSVRSLLVAVTGAGQKWEFNGFEPVGQL